jgi:hypothetical protein
MATRGWEGKDAERKARRMELLRQAASKPHNKYRNTKTTVDGIEFDSRKESERYVILKLMQLAGEISGLECQAPFILYGRRGAVATYIADFRYVGQDGKTVVEDVKSSATRTQVYRLKKKLFDDNYAQDGLTITEV